MQTERKMTKWSKREKIPGPLPWHNSHIIENRRPSVRFDVGPIVFVEAFSGATTEATNPKSLLNSKVMFETLLVLHADFGEDFRFPFDGRRAGFSVLGKA